MMTLENRSPHSQASPKRHHRPTLPDSAAQCGHSLSLCTKGIMFLTESCVSLQCITKFIIGIFKIWWKLSCHFLRKEIACAFFFKKNLANLSIAIVKSIQEIIVIFYIVSSQPTPACQALTLAACDLNECDPVAD